MCCFSQPVVSVSDTNLFGRMAGEDSQFLVYQMKFESKTKNAMILPLPVATPAGEGSVRFISLKEYGNFFADLAKGFPEELLIKHARSGSVDGWDDGASLTVFKVGNFVASFVPTVDDFSRLDKTFAIDRETWKKIPQYLDYGFAVFQLDDLVAKPHPMAFEFKSRSPEDLFFPTVHIHDGEVHKSEEFDHALYLQDGQFDKVVGKYQNINVKDPSTGFERSKWKARKFCMTEQTRKVVDPNLLVHRLVMRGQFENQDVIVARKPTRKWFWPTLKVAWPFLPAAAAVGCIGWLINRRNKVRAERKLANESTKQSIVE